MWHPRRAWAVALASASSIIVATGTAGPPTARAVAGDTVLVSVDTTGSSGEDSSVLPSVSADGRLVAFQSAAPDLVPRDTNRASDVFVRDLVAGTTRRVSVDTAGSDANGASRSPSISADGRYVAFVSAASDLVDDTADTGQEDVFLRDLSTGATTRITAGQSDGDSTRLVGSASVSRGGRHVAYDLSVGSPARFRTFVRDTVAGSTTIASTFPGGSPAGGFGPVISDDGRFVAFLSGDALVSGDTNARADVYRRDLVARRTEPVSLTTTGAFSTVDTAYGSSVGISADGRWVTSMDGADDLVPGDTNREPDVFRRDMEARTTVRVSVTSDGGQVIGVGFFHTVRTAVSDSGDRVVFSSDQSGLTANDRNGQPDVFVRTVSAGTTVLVSADASGSAPNGYSFTPDISGDGRFVVFGSQAEGVAPNDTNGGVDDVFGRPIEPVRTCRGKPATIVGTEGRDMIDGTSGNDVIVALGGSDVVRAGGGADVVCAGPGNDVVSGGDGDDELLGAVGNDRLDGGLGRDDLVGAAGTDACVGGAGPDFFAGCETITP